MYENIYKRNGFFSLPCSSAIVEETGVRKNMMSRILFLMHCIEKRRLFKPPEFVGLRTLGPGDALSKFEIVFLSELR